jgi:hypothetical protein
MGKSQVVSSTRALNPIVKKLVQILFDHDDIIGIHQIPIMMGKAVYLVQSNVEQCEVFL